MKKAEQILQIKKLLHRLDTGTNVDAGEMYENQISNYTDKNLAGREWK